jgi:hypothetical protein
LPTKTQNSDSLSCHMGGCKSKAFSDVPIAAYAQTHSRSQVHEVAVIPLTVANCPSPNCYTFKRLHEIYRTCPRVRQHFANSADEPLPIEAFYRQVVIDASHPNLPNGTCLPVAVATRWRGDEKWDVAGYIGCRGFDDEGCHNEVCHLQMFFKDGHKVPLTMPAIQLAARLYAEIFLLSHGGGLNHAAYPPGHVSSASSPATTNVQIPWPRSIEWTIRRSNMEVRRVIEAVLVFWSLRPARTGSPDQTAPPAPNLSQYGQPLMPFSPVATGPMPHYATTMHGGHAHTNFSSSSASSNSAFSDAGTHIVYFPLEQRTLTDDIVTLGTHRADAVASLMADLASWSSSPARWAHGVAPSPGLEEILPDNFQAKNGLVLLTGLSMNFRGTQQKTPAERRIILGDPVADMLEHIQPVVKSPTMGSTDPLSAVSPLALSGPRSARDRRNGRPTGVSTQRAAYLTPMLPRAAGPASFHVPNPMAAPYTGTYPHFSNSQPLLMPMPTQPGPHVQSPAVIAGVPQGFELAFMQGTDGQLLPVLIPARSTFVPHPLAELKPVIMDRHVHHPPPMQHTYGGFVPTPHSGVQLQAQHQVHAVTPSLFTAGGTSPFVTPHQSTSTGAEGAMHGAPFVPRLDSAPDAAFAHFASSDLSGSSQHAFVNW